MPKSTKPDYMQGVIQAGSTGVCSFLVRGKTVKHPVVVARDAPADARNLAVKIDGASEAVYVPKADIAFQFIITPTKGG